MSVEDVKATIRQGIDAADRSRRLLAEIAASLGDAATLGRQTAHDSRHPRVEMGLARISEATREVDRTVSRLEASVGAAKAYRAALG